MAMAMASKLKDHSTQVGWQVCPYMGNPCVRSFPRSELLDETSDKLLQVPLLEALVAFLNRQGQLHGVLPAILCQH